MKYQSPLKGLRRFKSQKEIRIKLGSGNRWVTMEFVHAKALMGLLQEMLTGDLIEVNEQACGCLEKVRK